MSPSGLACIYGPVDGCIVTCIYGHCRCEQADAQGKAVYAMLSRAGQFISKNFEQVSLFSSSVLI